MDEPRLQITQGCFSSNGRFFSDRVCRSEPPKVRRPMNPAQFWTLPFVRSVCRAERKTRFFGQKLVIELTELDLRGGKLSGLHHLLQFATRETDRRLSSFRHEDKPRIAGCRFPQPQINAYLNAQQPEYSLCRRQSSGKGLGRFQIFPDNSGVGETDSPLESTCINAESPPIW